MPDVSPACRKSQLKNILTLMGLCKHFKEGCKYLRKLYQYGIITGQGWRHPTESYPSVADRFGCTLGDSGMNGLECGNAWAGELHQLQFRRWLAEPVGMEKSRPHRGSLRAWTLWLSGSACVCGNTLIVSWAYPGSASMEAVSGRASWQVEARRFTVSVHIRFGFLK